MLRERFSCAGQLHSGYCPGCITAAGSDHLGVFLFEFRERQRGAGGDQGASNSISMSSAANCTSDSIPIWHRPVRDGGSKRAIDTDAAGAAAEIDHLASPRIEAVRYEDRSRSSPPRSKR